MNHPGQPSLRVHLADTVNDNASVGAPRRCPVHCFSVKDIQMAECGAALPREVRVAVVDGSAGEVPRRAIVVVREAVVSVQ